jgi:hypothetical protein
VDEGEHAGAPGAQAGGGAGVASAPDPAPPLLWHLYLEYPPHEHETILALLDWLHDARLAGMTGGGSSSSPPGHSRLPDVSPLDTPALRQSRAGFPLTAATSTHVANDAY